MPDGVHERSSLLQVWKHACIKKTTGMVQGDNGDLGLAEWNGRTGQNNVIIRKDGTVATCFSNVSCLFDWGNINDFTFDREQPI